VKNKNLTKAEIKKAKAEQAIRELYGLDKIYDHPRNDSRVEAVTKGQTERGGRLDLMGTH